MGVKATAQTYRAPDRKGPEQTVALSPSPGLSTSLLCHCGHVIPQYEACARAKYEYKGVLNRETDGIKVIRWLLYVDAKYQGLQLEDKGKKQICSGCTTPVI